VDCFKPNGIGPLCMINDQIVSCLLGDYGMFEDNFLHESRAVKTYKAILEEKNNIKLANQAFELIFFTLHKFKFFFKFFFRFPFSDFDPISDCRQFRFPTTLVVRSISVYYRTDAFMPHLQRLDVQRSDVFLYGRGIKDSKEAN
jgi:hypothetical protein